MYWMGESICGFKYTWIRIPGEIIQGYKDNIPFCCIVWYSLTKIITIISTSIIRTILREKHACGFSMDWYVFCRMMGGKINKKKRTFNIPRFWKLQYFRCPFCRWSKYERKLRWNTGTYWDWCGPYKSYYKQKYKERLK